MQTLEFPTLLSTNQHGFQNRDKPIATRVGRPQSKNVKKGAFLWEDPDQNF